MKKEEEEEKKEKKKYTPNRERTVHTSLGQTIAHRHNHSLFPTPGCEMEMKHTGKAEETYPELGFGWPWLAPLLTICKAIHGYL